MRRHTIIPRPDWRETAERLGFRFADMYGQAYWDETAYFSFTLRQVEDDLEDPTRELHAMCLELAERASRDDRLLGQLGIPAHVHDYVADSWRRRETSLYGRFDLAYDGTGPAKMLEYNADTPTGLYEAACFQWVWLEDCVRMGTLPADADQFNSIHERLIDRFRSFRKDSIFHFAGDVTSIEDSGTLDYLMDCASQAGHLGRAIGIEQVGIDALGRFTDLSDRVIDRMFKLHPWEWVFETDVSAALVKSGCKFVEPGWKAMLSTKAILPILWEMFPGHPNLLPAYFGADPRSGEMKDHVRKPIFSREGANITLVVGDEVHSSDGMYDDCPVVVQQATRLFSSEHGHAVIGSWIVGEDPVGIGIREDSNPITQDLSRFVPHAIIG